MSGIVYPLLHEMARVPFEIWTSFDTSAFFGITFLFNIYVDKINILELQESSADQTYLPHHHLHQNSSGQTMVFSIL